MPELVSATFDWLGTAPAEYKFYDGAVTVHYDDDEHSYTRYDAAGNLVLIPGVTTAVHIVDKSAALTQWAANMACSYIRDEAELYALSGSWRDFDTATLQTWLEKAKYAHRDYKDNAAETGHIAHAWIEDFIKAAIAGKYDRMLAMLDELPEDERARNGCVASLEWMARHQVRWVLTERKIYSRRHDYAGTMDGLAYITACGDKDCCGEYEGVVKVPATFTDQLAVVDWKTSNGLYPEYDYQTAAYTLALIEELDLDIQLRVIARLGKEDAQFESRYLPPERLYTDFEIFLGCLSLYRSIERRKAEDKAQKDAVKAAERAAKDEAEQALRERKAAYREALRTAKLYAKTMYKELRGEKVTVIDAEAQCAAVLEDTIQMLSAHYPEFVKEPEEAEEVAA